MKIFNCLASAVVVALLVGAFSHVHHQSMLEELERETRQRCAAHCRQMLSDTHQLYKSYIAEHQFPVVCLETEITAREMLWHMRETFSDLNCIEVH